MDGALRARRQGCLSSPARPRRKRGSGTSALWRRGERSGGFFLVPSHEIYSRVRTKRRCSPGKAKSWRPEPDPSCDNAINSAGQPGVKLLPGRGGWLCPLPQPALCATRNASPASETRGKKGTAQIFWDNYPAQRERTGVRGKLKQAPRQPAATQQPLRRENPCSAARVDPCHGAARATLDLGLLPLLDFPGKRDPRRIQSKVV